MTTSTSLRASIRWLIRRDFPEVLTIEQAAFAEPWGEEELLERLRKRYCIGMVALAGDRDDLASPVAGFMVYELHARRLDLLRFAVHPGYARSGVGRRMAAKLIDKLSAGHRDAINLHVRESNDAGIAFWRAMGFRGVTVARDHFATEDAYLMRYSLAGRDHVTLGEPCS